MALKKEIRRSSGIVLSYHRIKDIKNIVNDGTYLTVLSYPDSAARQIELSKPKYSPRGTPVYFEITYFKLDYNDTLSIEQAYDYLKTLDMFVDSENI